MTKTNAVNGSPPGLKVHEYSDRFTIAPKPPFDLAFGARFFASRSFHPLNHPAPAAADDLASRSLTFQTAQNGNGVEIQLSQKRPGSGKLTVRWRTLPWSKTNGVPVGDVTRADVRDIVRRIFSLDLDLEPFYKQANTDFRLAGPFSRVVGFKPVLAPNVFDAALWAIVGQQVTFTFARTLKHRLQKRYGRALRTESGLVQLTPEPKTLSRTKVNSLRALQLSESKANYIHNLSRAIVSGDLDLESLSRKPYDLAIEELVALKGIGVWTANYILMRGAGHRDALPLGDAGLKRAVRNAYGLQANPAPDLIEKYAEPFRPYRSLYTMYLWQTLD